MKKTKFTAFLCASVALCSMALAACKEENTTPDTPPAPVVPSPTTILSGSFGVEDANGFLSTQQNVDNCTLILNDSYATFDDTDRLYTHVFDLDFSAQEDGRYFFLCDYEMEYGVGSGEDIEYVRKQSHAIVIDGNTENFYIRLQTMFQSESYDFQLISLPTQTAKAGENSNMALHAQGDWEFTFVAPAAGQYKVAPNASSAAYFMLGLAGDGAYVDYHNYLTDDGALIITAQAAGETVSFFGKTKDAEQTTAGFTISEYVPEKFPASYTLSLGADSSTTLDIAVKAGGSTNIVIQGKALYQLAWTDSSLSYTFNGVTVTDTALLFAGKYQGMHTLTIRNNGTTDSEQTLTFSELTQIPVGTSSIYLPSSNDNRQFVFENYTVQSAMQLSVADENVAAIYTSETVDSPLGSTVINPADGAVRVQISSKSTFAVVTQITFAAPSEN